MEMLVGGDKFTLALRDSLKFLRILQTYVPLLVLFWAP